jgi:hypothetical protein
MLQNSGRAGLKLATFNYGFAAGFAAFVGVFSYWNGDAANLVALKTVFAPFFLLASRSLQTFFKDPVDMSRLSAKSIEIEILSALLVAGFFVIVTWNTESTLAGMLWNFLIMFSVLVTTHLLLLALRSRRNSAAQS